MVDPDYPSIQKWMGVKFVRVVAVFSKEKSITVGSFRVNRILGTSNIVSRIIDTKNVVSEHSVVFEKYVIAVTRWILCGCGLGEGGIVFLQDVYNTGEDVHLQFW